MPKRRRERIEWSVATVRGRSEGAALVFPVGSGPAGFFGSYPWIVQDPRGGRLPCPGHERFHYGWASVRIIGGAVMAGATEIVMAESVGCRVRVD